MDNIGSLEQQAIDFAKRGDFAADAKRVNEELTRLAPSNQGGWTRLARCYLEVGQLDEATAALESALQLNAQNTIARSLQLEVTKRRTAITVRPAPTPKRRGASSRTEGSAPATGHGFGRAEFAALGQLPPTTAVEALGPRIEALLMAVSERPFAAKVVEARNRAGRSGSKLFRRNSFHEGDAGHIFAFHHGGRWEPQINVGFFAAPQWGRDAIRAGIGFNLTGDGADRDREAGQERVLAHFERFQQLVSTAWRQLLTDWMASHAGFIQYGARPPAVDLLPKDAVAWLIETQNARELGWVFCGRWLFADRPDDAAIMSDAARLTRWIDQTFTELLPLWMSVFREAETT